MKRMDLMAADPSTGTSRVVVTEEQETYVEGLRFYGVADNFLTLLEDGRFLWLSERDGWTHLYLYGLDGTLVRRLTHGEFPVNRVVAVDHDAGWIYFMAQAERDRPYDDHLYRIDFEGAGWRRLTEGVGRHQIAFAPAATHFVDTHSSVGRPPAVELRQADGELLQVLSTADVSALEALQWTPPEEFVVKAADGETDLWGLLYKPYDFDPGRSYPIIDFIYAGSQSAVVPRTFTSSRRAVFAQAMAQFGYLTFVVDARGTPLRAS